MRLWLLTCDMRKQPDNNCKGPRGRYRDPARGSERAVAGVGLPFMTRRAKVVFGSRSCENAIADCVCRPLPAQTGTAI